MPTMPTALARLRVASLGAVLALGAACAANPPATLPPSARAIQVQTVRRGTVEPSYTYNGNIQSRASVNVLPRTSARIERINADVGSRVQTGDVLVVLDRSQLAAQVRQAEGALSAAESRLALARAPSRPEEMQAAQAAVDSAESRLRQMLRGGRPEELDAARANITAAQAKLAQVLEGPTPAELASAQGAVDASRASLRSSQERLEHVLGGGSPEDRQAVEAGVEAARATLGQVRARREGLRNPPADQVQAVRSNVESAQANLDAARERWAVMQAGGSMADQVNAQAGVDSSVAALQAAQDRLIVLLAGGALADREAAQAAVDSARSQLRTARVQLDQLRYLPYSAAAVGATQQLSQARAQQNAALQAVNGLCPADPACQAAAGALQEANRNVATAQSAVLQTSQGAGSSNLGAALTGYESALANLKAAQARVDQLASPGTDIVQAARSGVESAQASLDAAVARQRQLREPAPDLVASLRSAVDTAESNLQAAKARLDLLVAGGAPEDQEAADFAILNAQATLDQALARRNALLRPSDADIANAQAAVDAGASNVTTAEARLADLQAGPRAADVQAALSQVDQAQSQLALRQQPYTPDEIQQQQNAVTQARATLAMRAQPARPEEIAQAVAAVDQARASVDLARDQAAEAFVTAPFDGVVSARLMAEGALANPSQPLMTLVTDAVEMTPIVEANRLGQITEGRAAILTTPVYPGEEFPAVVVSVSPTADPRSRNFQAKVVPEDPDGKLREGMFAQVRIVGDSRQGAVLVPNSAIVQRAGKTVAFVVVDGHAVRRELQLGATDGDYTEVLAGLEPGDQVVAHGEEILNDGDAVAPTRGQ